MDAGDLPAFCSGAAAVVVQAGAAVAGGGAVESTGGPAHSGPALHRVH